MGMTLIDDDVDAERGQSVWHGHFLHDGEVADGRDGMTGVLTRILALADAHRLLLGGIAAWMSLLGVMIVLYVWVASRQVRPRPTASSIPARPTSPTLKRKRHSKSFSDMRELEREILKERAVRDRQDWNMMPMSLQRKCGPEHCKLIYDTLSKVFSFLRNEYIGALARDLEILTFQNGDKIFAQGQHPGSILIVASGEVSLVIHGEDGQTFTKSVTRGETVTSSLSLLAVLVDTVGNETSSDRGDLINKVAGSLSAVSTESGTEIFEIPASAVQEVLHQFPDSFYRLAQVTISQLEKITAKSLVDHFGLSQNIIAPVPIVRPSIVEDQARFGPKVSVADLLCAVAESVDAVGDDGHVLVEHARLIVCEDERIISEKVVSKSIHILVNGTARVELEQRGKHVTVCEIDKGCEVGLARCFMGFHSTPRIVCHKGSAILAIDHAAFARFVQTNRVAMACVRHLIQQYSPLVCVTDSSFDSIHLHGGESLFDRGAICDSVFTVISGRLRAIQIHMQRTTPVETTTELVRGATLGVMDMLAAGRSNASVFAVRDSQIAQMPRCVFDYVVNCHPTVLVHFTRNLALHLPRQGTELSRSESVQQGNSNFMLSLGDAAEPAPTKQNDQALPLGTIAVISLTKTNKIRIFCSHLHSALKTLATTDIVSSSKAHSVLGEDCLSRSRLTRANLTAWLGDIESSHDLVIYEADPQLSTWTELCIRQADHILLLCSDTEPPQSFLTDIVDILQAAWERKNVEISVVRIRDENWTLTALEGARQAAASELSKSSALKRKLRLWNKSAMLPRFLLPMEKYEWISCFHNVQTHFEDHQADFLRLSRRITGRAVGLVLGGGGARGLAHLGVLRALEECGVHVDVVGGTSIGAFIGAMYALHPHHLDLVRSKIGVFSVSLSSVVEKLKDLTLPIASFFNGTRFNRSIQDYFFDLSVEDLVLNYFCVTTDIAKSRMSVHRSGHVWKYVRASMSLQGYLPPISEGGSLLLDGGYMNNLPADVMKEEGGIKYVLAVDVGSEPRRGYYGYGTTLSGWWLLWNKLNPFAQTVSVPSMGDVSAALAYVSSEQHKERMKAECIDLYLRPPVNDYGTLQFEKMDEIIEVGYRYALPRVQEWAKRVLAVEPEADIVNDNESTISDNSTSTIDDEEVAVSTLSFE